MQINKTPLPLLTLVEYAYNSAWILEDCQKNYCTNDS